MSRKARAPSFVGIGFVDAYEATANNAVFGSSKSDALQNYPRPAPPPRAPPTGQHQNRAANTRR